MVSIRSYRAAAYLRTSMLVQRRIRTAERRELVIYFTKRSIYHSSSFFMQSSTHKKKRASSPFLDLGKIDGVQGMPAWLLLFLVLQNDGYTISYCTLFFALTIVYNNNKVNIIPQVGSWECKMCAAPLTMVYVS